jgi:hypothetical protein
MACCCETIGSGHRPMCVQNLHGVKLNHFISQRMDNARKRSDDIDLFKGTRQNCSGSLQLFLKPCRKFIAVIRLQQGKYGEVYDSNIISAISMCMPTFISQTCNSIFSCLNCSTSSGSVVSSPWFSKWT